MGEFVDYVNHGAARITSRIVDQVLRHLPLWKVESTQINAPRFPHLVDQLEFLANAVEDSAEGAYKDLHRPWRDSTTITTVTVNANHPKESQIVAVQRITHRLQPGSCGCQIGD